MGGLLAIWLCISLLVLYDVLGWSNCYQPKHEPKTEHVVVHLVLFELRVYLMI
jgi:hypothetical protein